MSDFKLYEINDQLELLLNEIHSIAEENEGEVPDDLSNKLDSLNLLKETKIFDIAKYIKTLKVKSEGIKNEIEKLQSRYKTYNNCINSLKRYLKMNIETGRKYEDSAVKISWRKTDSVEIINLNIIPDKYIERKIVAHLLDIKSDLKANINVPGVKLQHNNNIVIR